MSAFSQKVGGPVVKLNTGWDIPLVGFGTYKITGQQMVDKAVDAALQFGYRHFDTAKLYWNEKELGNALEKFMPKYGLRREDVFLTTKFFPIPSDTASEEVPRLIKESLKNLKTDYIDLVLIHYPTLSLDEKLYDDHEGNLKIRRANWLTLEQIPESKIHSIGVSNYELSHLEEMEQYGTRVPAVNQLEYHPHFRRQSVKDYCAGKGIFFQAFSSLGRQHPDLIGDLVVRKLATKYVTTPQIILLSFATSQNVAIVPKSENPERIRDNFKCLEVRLALEDIKMLNSIEKDQHYIRNTPWLVK